MERRYHLLITVIFFLVFSLRAEAQATDATRSRPPMPNSNITKLHPSHYVDTQRVANEAYTTNPNLPPCPGDPIRMVNNSPPLFTLSPWPSAPICPIVNDQFQFRSYYPSSVASQVYSSSGYITLYNWLYDPVKVAMVYSIFTNGAGQLESVYCPSQCTVTRYANIDSWGNIVSTNDAVCPKGYVKVGSYNIQKEIIYIPNARTMPYPMSQAQYFSYLNAHATCSRVGPIQIDSTTSCYGSAETVGPSGVSLLSGWLYYWGYNTPNGQSFYVTTTINGSLGSGIGQYVGITPAENHVYTDVIGSYCSTVLVDITLNPINSNLISCSMGANNDFVQCIINSGPGRGTIFSSKFNLQAQYLQCSLPAGLYYSGKMAPISAICARASTTWSNTVPNNP